MNFFLKTFVLCFAFLSLANLNASDVLKINGAGATFPYPIYSKWLQDYKKIKANVEINYQSVGSGAGIQQLLKGTVDFAASDVLMTDEELKKLSTPIFQIPMILGSIAIVYNVDGIASEIKLSPEILSEIYLGKITKWNDPKILSLNADLKLSDSEILVIQRADGSGTTAIFTDYLSKVSAEFKTKVGASKSVSWPVGIGGKGNEGVTALVQKTKGSIAYVELAYAINSKLKTAKIQNLSGNFISPNPTAASLAANEFLKTLKSKSSEKKAKLFDASSESSLVNMPGKDTYPIAAFTFLLLPDIQSIKNDEIRSFIKWALTSGQDVAPSLHYAKLPGDMAASLIEEISN